MSKNKFKTLVKNACKNEALTFLLNEKESKNKSKMAHLSYSSLELQPYLKSDLLYNRTKKFLFRLRTRMVNVPHNFGKKKRCKICFTGDDDQCHLLKCLRIKLVYPELLQNLNYNDIFDTDINKQAEIAKIIERAYRLREEIIDDLTE